MNTKKVVLQLDELGHLRAASFGIGSSKGNLVNAQLRQYYRRADIGELRLCKPGDVPGVFVIA